jgi:hypothetical protein
MHAALTGRSPFAAKPGELPIAFALRVMRDDPPDLAAEGIPVALAAVVERAMAKDPADRYADAAEFREALEGVNLADRPAFVSGPVVDSTIRLPVSEGLDPPAADLSPTAEVAPADITGSGPARPSSRLALWLFVPALVVAAIIAFLISRQAHSHPASSTATTPTTAAARKTTATKRAPVVAQAATAVQQTVNGYYGLINEHRLDDSFGWLSPSYQQRSPQGAYRGFWNTIARVDVLSVTPADHQATVTLRFTRTNGSVSTERGTMRFTDGGSAGHLLIDDYRAG